jgi:hypothetical protein
MNRWIIIAVSFLFIITPIVAQEIDCDVTINMEKLTTEARENLSDFLPQVKEYINGNRWTPEGLGGEKIRCTINISFQGAPRDNHFVVQAFIGSQRPIFQLGQNTAMLRILDDKWEFDYIRNQPLIHNDLRFDPLLSFLDYYINIILGYDFESYKAGDGTKYFQKALEITNKARGYGGAGSGWDIGSQNTYTRGQFVDELLNSKFFDFREAVYKYHYKGLDLLAKDEARARKNMFAALEKIGKLKERINQNSFIIRTFFDTKYKEIAHNFTNDADKDIFAKLSRIDPSHKQDYDTAAKDQR